LFCDYRELLKEIQASYNPAKRIDGDENSGADFERWRFWCWTILRKQAVDWVRDIVELSLNADITRIGTTDHHDELS